MTSQGAPRDRLAALDPRLKTLAALIIGLSAWRSGWQGLLFYALVLVPVFLAPSRRQNLRALKAYALFAGFWVALKLALDLVTGIPPESAVRESAWLAARLAVVLCAGLALALTTSPRSLGLALAWALRPVLGRRAWKAALALALTVHFIPLAWLTLSQTRQTIARRLPEIPRRRKTMLLVQAGLRNMTLYSWDQALAVSARGLDRAEAWRPAFPRQPLTWTLGLVVIAAGLWLALG